MKNIDSEKKVRKLRAVAFKSSIYYWPLMLF